ncbi:MAG: DUF3047 domain-containing protein [Comamonadaceae bacterium]|nr:MAG: DUF3047 domain-containing protein [Comamonadaceae bacterium]
MTFRIVAFACATAALLLAGCANPPQHAASGPPNPWAGSTSEPWTHKAFPGKTPTHYAYARLDGRDAVHVRADASASMLRQAVRIEPAQLGRLRFSWKVPALIAHADLAVRDKDDAPVRIVLAFEGDRSRFSRRDAALAELVRSVMGEEMPYATLMYVWCNERPPGTVIRSPRTDRVRKLVVESGPARLGTWLDYERDVRADFQRVFGEKPGALVGVAIMTDSDNTRSRTQAWYGPLRFLPVDPRH